MGDIVDIRPYQRRCENCVHWIPPDADDGRVRICGSACGRPGGWTFDPRINGCRDFKRKFEHKCP